MRKLNYLISDFYINKEIGIICNRRNRGMSYWVILRMTTEYVNYILNTNYSITEICARMLKIQKKHNIKFKLNNNYSMSKTFKSYEVKLNLDEMTRYLELNLK